MIRVEHLESLAYALSEAAELEHGLMCCYLYAAFSIGQRCEQRRSLTDCSTVQSTIQPHHNLTRSAVTIHQRSFR